MDSILPFAAGDARPVEEPPGSLIGADHRPRATDERSLGDFTATPAVLRLVPLAVGTGVPDPVVEPFTVAAVVTST